MGKYRFTVIILLLVVKLLSAQNGIVKSYYVDGKVQTEASYVNDVLDGAVISYFPNGKINIEKNYSQGILDGYVREYYPSGIKKEEYLVNRGVQDGSYRKYYENGQLKELSDYSYGRLINRQFFNADSNYKASNENTIVQKIKPAEPIKKEVIEKKEAAAIPEIVPDLLCDVQVCPVPIGGTKSIQDLLVYPEHALRYGIQGIVLVIATINEAGDVTKTQVLKGLGYGCDEAAEDVLRKTKFVPGINDNKACECKATIPVVFRIVNKN